MLSKGYSKHLKQTTASRRLLADQARRSSPRKVRFGIGGQTRRFPDTHLRSKDSSCRSPRHHNLDTSLSQGPQDSPLGGIRRALGGPRTEARLGPGIRYRGRLDFHQRREARSTVWSTHPEKQVLVPTSQAILRHLHQGSLHQSLVEERVSQKSESPATWTYLGHRSNKLARSSFHSEPNRKRKWGPLYGVNSLFASRHEAKGPIAGNC